MFIQAPSPDEIYFIDNLMTKAFEHYQQDVEEQLKAKLLEIKKMVREELIKKIQVS